MRKLLLLLLTVTLYVACSKDEVEIDIVPPVATVIEPESPITTEVNTDVFETTVEATENEIEIDVNEDGDQVDDVSRVLTNTTTLTVKVQDGAVIETVSEESSIEEGPWEVSFDVSPIALDGAYKLIDRLDPDTLEPLNWAGALYFELTDRRISLVGYPINIDGISVDQFQIYNGGGDSFYRTRDEFSVEVISRNVIHMKYRAKVNHIDEHGNSSFFYKNMIDVLEKIESLPEVLTEDRIAELLRQTNSGFYSDDLYASLDIDDPYDYVRVFVEDAARYGIDISHVLDQEIDIEFNITSFGSGEPWGTAHAACNDNRIKLKIALGPWINNIPGTERHIRLRLMYHELGHDILNFDHPYDDQGEVRKDIDDIMGYGLNPSTWSNWQAAVDNIFSSGNNKFNCN